MKLPNFLIAGFPKCGSTSLHYYLSEHPDIFMPEQKELHYFTNPIISQLDKGPGDREVTKFFVRDFQTYKKLYKAVSLQTAIGDTSPSYINHPSIIPEIKETLGANTKIIVLLRDPIKRAYSNYLHLIRENRENLSFWDALQKEELRKVKKYGDFWYYTFNSFYYEKIKYYKKEFDEVYLITSEELKENTQQVLQKIYRFLEVDESFIPKNINTTYNEGGIYKKNIWTRFIFEQSKGRSFIKKVLPMTSGMKRLKLKIIENYKKSSPSIDEKSEKYLANLFREDVMKLKKDFGVNTELWNEKLSNE